jgi:enoyl-CoA hydratase/carnithine racemase
LGFVQEVVAPEELRTRATALAKLIAAQAPLAVSKRSRLTPPSLGRSIAWLADRRRDPTPINSRKKRKSSVIAAFTPKAVLKRKVRAYLRKTIST